MWLQNVIVKVSICQQLVKLKLEPFLELMDLDAHSQIFMTTSEHDVFLDYDFCLWDRSAFSKNAHNWSKIKLIVDIDLQKIKYKISKLHELYLIWNI